MCQVSLLNYIKHTIVDVPADSNNDAPDAIYDLSGRKHAEPQENRVNIIGKKKVLFRQER